MHHSHFILGGLLIMSIIVSGTDGATFYMPTAAYDSILVMSLMGAENHIAAVNVNNGRIIGHYIPNGMKEDMITSASAK